MTDEKNLKKIDSPNVELPKVNESLKEHSFPIGYGPNAGLFKVVQFNGNQAAFILGRQGWKFI